MSQPKTDFRPAIKRWSMASQSGQCKRGELRQKSEERRAKSEGGEMRLNAEVLRDASSYINPLKERELDLRAHNIPSIENLGVTKDQNDAIDFTENDIRILGNIPSFPRLRSLFMARNRIESISGEIGSAVPNLETLILTSNRLEKLEDLTPLASLRRLVHLSLLENPVAQMEYYREWVIWRCPSVRILDFQRVRQAERRRAMELFRDKSSD